MQQTGARAILNWSSFNVGANTSLVFDQQGNSNWVALNRVVGASSPSQILGRIQADGQVYVINQNGIIFGGASQINVGSLIASAALISDAQFKANGIYSNVSGTSYTPSFTGAGGSIVVEQGALITTRAPGAVTQGGGFVMLLGAKVDNAGSITTPKGQTVLAAGRDFVIRKGYATDANSVSTTRGSEVAPGLWNAGSNSWTPGGGAVRNSGLVFAQQGDITLAGHAVTQSGVAIATTSVDVRGTIHLLNAASDGSGSVTLGAASLTQIMPELGSADTALNSQRDALTANSRVGAGSGQFDNLSSLADRLDLGRVEIVSGGVVKFDGGSLTLAQGGQIAVSAAGRVFTANNAVLDVSGTSSALPMSANSLKINIQPNEMRDAPVNRDSGVLTSKDVWIDARDLVLVPAGTGGYASDRYYTKGGLLEVSGYLANTGHTIGEWTAVGGVITLSAAELVAQAGSVFNLSGGTITYQAGQVLTTNVLGADGRLYPIGSVPAGMPIIALGRSFTVDHSRWGVKDVWGSPSHGATTSRWDEGYTIGRDAGRLVLSAPTSVFEGSIVAEVITGTRQTDARPDGVTDGYKLTQNTVPLAGTLAIGRYSGRGRVGGYASDVLIGDVADIAAGLDATSAVPSARAGTVWLDAGRLAADRLGGLSIVTTETIAVTAPLTLADGGRIEFVAPVVKLGADVTARSGSITVTNVFTPDGDATGTRALLKNGGASITVGAGVTLDLRGLWANLRDQPADGGKLAYLDGGDVVLTSTHDVTLSTGSRIDVSSGAAILATGKTKGGRGGNVTLIADQEITDVAANGLLTLNGTIAGYGVAGGGTLTLNSGTAVAIGGKLLDTDGVLKAGERSEVELVLAESYTVRAGDALPLDYSYTATVARPGEAVGPGGLVSYRDVTLAADWVPPVLGSSYYIGARNPFVIDNQTFYGYQVKADGTVFVSYNDSHQSYYIYLNSIPAGTTINFSNGSLFAGYVVPADAFPNGMPVVPYTKTVAAGSAAPTDIALASGSTIAAGATLNRSVAVVRNSVIDPSVFQTGFSNYAVTARTGVVVAAGTTLDLAVPVYRFGPASYLAASGTAPAAALELWTPPTYFENPSSGTLTRRAGASLSLTSTRTAAAGTVGAGGPVVVAAGAAITVDPGQSIRLAGGDVVVEGRLTAPGGSIILTMPNGNNASDLGSTEIGLIWVGERAVLDVAGRAVTATDFRGRRYGSVMDGGTIAIGGKLDWDAKGEAGAGDAFVVIRPGALLDASGASAVIDIGSVANLAQPATTSVSVASDGGSIVLASNNGLYLDGTLRAVAGGAGAAGGTLAVALETPNYWTATTTGDVLRHRELVLAQTQGGSLLQGDVTAVSVRGALATGTARFGVDRIIAGGFGNLSLLVDGLLTFDGDVSLSMAQSLRLYAGSYALGDAAASNATVSLAAPYVRLAGVAHTARDYYSRPTVLRASGPSQQATAALFRVDADLIDIRDDVGFGARGTDSFNKALIDRRGFALVDLDSRGDLRLLAGNSLQSLGGSATTRLASTGNIVLTAAQIYPATNVIARIIAGYRSDSTAFAPGTSLTIRRAVAGDVAMPWSAFGQLRLLGETIDQGGIVRAPLGVLTLGSAEGSGQTDAVTLRAGSITSVSGAGLVMPYGGTVDGISYTYAGAAIRLTGLGGSKIINLNSAHVAVDDGALLDLSGGGTLTGAGFFSGRGGSVNVLTTSLASAGPGYAGISAIGNAVYAIVPSSAAAAAPVAPEAGWGDPVVGRTITVPAGVPGLPAGTYTLLPSTYALLPGAFRVEIGAGDQTALAGTAAIGNGSYVVAGTLGFANTSIRDALPSRMVITSAAAVRTHSSYNETSYDAFVAADGQRLGVPRAMLAADAGSLAVTLFKIHEDSRKAFTFAGTLALGADAAAGGYAGSVSLGGVGEVLAVGQSSAPGLPGVSVWADALDALAAPRLLLNANLGISYGQSGRYVAVSGSGDIVVRSGAVIRAGEVIIGSGPRWSSAVGAFVNGSITIEEGAAIIAKAGGARSFDSSDGYVFTGAGVLAVSSGRFNLLLSNDPSATAGIDITVGACVATCTLPTRLIADGTIAIATSGALTIADNTSYGAKYLVLGVAAVDLGEKAAIAAAAAAGRLPAGLVLDQAKLAALLAGNTATGAPALETLVLNARDGVHMFGSVVLDASSLDLVLGTPAIYGYGAASDVATIRANSFIWTGSQTAGAPVQALLGSGRLAVEAGTILFGYGPDTQPASNAVDDRLALGFSGVTLAAREAITASGTGTLGVYLSRGGYTAAEGWAYAGGDLTLVAPVITGTASSKLTITAGGDVTLRASSGAAHDPGSAALGAALTVTGRSILVDTAVVLPSGSLTLKADGDVTLAGGGRIDLAGRAVTINDVTRYSWGGDLTLTSSNGDIVQTAGSSTDVSAVFNRGGTISVTATGGRVDLAGTIRGGASGWHDAGGTLVPYDGAELTVQARTLADFAGLNARLSAGEVFGARRFRIKEGDLAVGDGVKARDVEITLDGGSLTVNGTIDAAAFQVGTIRLAAKGDLVVNGLLDAHGSGLRLDSYGQVIESANRGIVHLTTTAGLLTLGAGAVIDLRAGTSGSATALGTLDLDAPRVGANDVAVTVAGAPTIRGAKTIAVNAFRSYDDAPLANAPDVSGHTPQLITQTYLDAIDGDSRAFINAAQVNNALTARLAGLGSYHLRPGVEIVSNAAVNPFGNLTVVGDLDLSNHRYGPGSDPTNPALRGYGEPGVLVLRAAGDLTIHGSISDGFAPPPATPDDQGWMLTKGPTPYGGDIVVPIDGVVLASGTQFAAGAKLNYDVPVAAMTLPSGTVLPADAVLAGSTTLAAGTIVAATIYKADGSVAYAAGTVLGTTATLTAGMKLGAGTRLAANAAVAAMIWPKGVALPVAMTTTEQVTLARGAVIPSMTNVQLPNDESVDLRGGVTSHNWAVAPMLGAGTTSWTLGLVAGANTASADRRAVASPAAGSIVLADTHYRITTTPGGTLIGLNQKGVDYLVDTVMYGYIPDGMSKSDLLGKTEAEIVKLYGAFSWDDFGLPGFWEPSAGNILTGLTAQGVDTVVAVAGGLPPGINSKAELLGKTEPQIVALYMAFSWDDFGLPGFWDYGNGNSAVVSTPTTRTITAPAFSVVRTGTGDLSLAAARDLRMQSLYGVYTAGTATSVTAAYDQARGTLSDGSVLGSQATGYADALASYHAWYPDHGGNLSITVGRDLIGDIHAYSGANGDISTGLAGNWLWRQGTGSAATDSAVPTAWWVNFGTYARVDTGTLVGEPVLVGFTGFGTLGGGDVGIRVGGDAGKITLRGTDTGATNDTGRSQGLVVAVASTGRVGSDGSIVLTGGGDIDMRIAGALNPFSESSDNSTKTALSGSIVDLRGAAQVSAGSIGEVRTFYRQSLVNDPVDSRGVDPFATTGANSFSGLTLVPGDSMFAVQARGDLVIAGAGDATRSVLLDPSAFTVGGITYSGGGHSWFTLWTDHSAIDLVSAGGNMAPSKAGSSIGGTFETDVTGTWPATLRVAALGGSVYYGASAGATLVETTADLLAPSPSGELSILAAGSIYAGTRIYADPYVSRHSVLFSSTGTALPTPFDPAFASLQTNVDFSTVISNLSIAGEAMDMIQLGGTGRSYFWNQTYSLFAFGPDTAATATATQGAAAPIRIYAGGDIVGLGVGTRSSYRDAADTAVTTYVGGAPLRMIAGRDIVASGTMAKPDVIVHSNETDVSVIQAGRDIVHSSVVVAGPGTLEVTAGRNILMEDQASITSVGTIVAGDTRPGAALALLAGAGSEGPDYAALRARYLDPVNLLPAGTPLAGSGKVAKVYDAELIVWLQQRYSYTASSTADALAHFDTLAPEQQRVFLRSVYYAELKAGGREYNDPSSSRYGSYARGREAIATLFPVSAAAGQGGDIRMFGGSGVRTNFGGDIQMLAPSGQIVIGVEGTVPPASAGVVTQGSGDISFYSKGSILLGLSRIMTTFGGNILAWSAEGDINAGRGSKTTQVYTPPKRVYDAYGNVTLSPAAPATGAGIATLNPVPGTPAGDVDLIAPLGTIDAGEAGIRVSGDINLAARQIVNAANIQVQGTSTGLPTVQAPPVAALTAASNVAGAATPTTAGPTQSNDRPSIILVEFLGFGGGDGSPPPGSDDRRRSEQQGYNFNSAFQIIQVGDLAGPARSNSR
ncbi:filamentous hemagglutinin family protein [Rhodopseudomonas palustris]|nr:filamentous hemagglutinin family protein [Rhodopseudomonas palustris]